MSTNPIWRLFVVVFAVGVMEKSSLGEDRESKFTQSPPWMSSVGEASDHLSLAADCLARGDDAGAATYLARHVASNPSQVIFRSQLADLLAKLDRLTAAQSQYESAIAHAQDGPKAAREQLVHFHTRLMEIARLREDSYAEHLHRGIGLCIVATRLTESGKLDDVERILIKAASALKEAQGRRPDDARPAWYLYLVWSKLDQPRPAEKCLQKAIAAAPLSSLTPVETRELFLASGRQTIAK
jgi:tetratricopeptide (TPR) repeat protein